MLSTDEFLSLLSSADICSATGVPCSILAPALDVITRSSIHYIPAINEGAGLAIACGQTMAGRRAATLMQDSGFGNIINPLTSLAVTYKIGLLIIVGYHNSTTDEPQHHAMSQLLMPIAHALELPMAVLDPEPKNLPRLSSDINNTLSQGRPFILAIQRNSIAQIEHIGTSSATVGLTRDEVLLEVLKNLPESSRVVSTTGHLSRALYQMKPSFPSFYMVGSMGHASSIGLGITASLPSKHLTVVIDGDGAVLMHLGTLASIGQMQPDKFLHIVFDNGAYDSTGGQPSAAVDTRIEKVALACGYSIATRCTSLACLRAALNLTKEAIGPQMILVKVASCPLHEPPSIMNSLEPAEIRQEFSSRLSAQ